MKRILTLLCISFISLVLISCANGRYPYPKKDLGNETWRSQIITNPSVFAAGADQWFLAGGASRARVENDASRAIITNTTIERVTNFDGIKATGNFQVQITGTPNENRVWVEGPNDAVRALVINMNDDVLCISQAKDAPDNMDQVIVHVRMKRLNYLDHDGQSLVEGVRLDGDHLQIIAKGCGNIYLAGRLNVKSIVANGPGSVNIFTLDSYGTDIETYDKGSVNFSARRAVYLRNIKHKGSGDINIIGAESPGLNVSAEGKGKIGIFGCVNIKEIRASGKTCVFITRSKSSSACVYVYDDARVGIDGTAYSFNGYTTRTARLYTRYLVANNSYVKASGQSHMNVYATNKIFASATDYATIYFYGDPNIMTAFMNGDGGVIYMGTMSSPNEAIVSHCAKPRKRGCGSGCGVAEDDSPCQGNYCESIRRGKVRARVRASNYIK